MRKHFPVREKSGNLVKTGKVSEFYSIYWKNQKKYTGKLKKNWKSQGNLSIRNSKNCANMEPYFNLKNNFKKYWKTVKNTVFWPNID